MGTEIGVWGVRVEAGEEKEKVTSGTWRKARSREGSFLYTSDVEKVLR